MHHKYIRKEKTSSGKFRYFYDTDTAKAIQKELKVVKDKFGKLKQTNYNKKKKQYLKAVNDETRNMKSLEKKNNILNQIYNKKSTNLNKHYELDPSSTPESKTYNLVDNKITDRVEDKKQFKANQALKQSFQSKESRLQAQEWRRQMNSRNRQRARKIKMEDAEKLYQDSFLGKLFGPKKKSSNKTLKRSANGTTWADHKYKEIINGRYIYDEEADRKKNGGKSQFDEIREKNKDKDWQEVIYEHVEAMIKKNPKLNTDMIKDAPIEDFAQTLKALTYLDVDEMTIADLEKMRGEIVSHYATNTPDEDKEKEEKDSKTSSTTTKTDDKKEDETKSEEKQERVIDTVNRKKRERIDQRTYKKGSTVKTSKRKTSVK